MVAPLAASSLCVNVETLGAITSLTRIRRPIRRPRAVRDRSVSLAAAALSPTGHCDHRESLLDLPAAEAEVA
jgi:hypothetical protein